MTTEKATLTDVSLQEVLGLGAAMVDPKSIGGAAPLVIIPNNFKVESLEKLLPAPMRAKGNVKFLDAESFIRYVNKHKDQPGVESAARHGAGQVGGEAKSPDTDDVATMIYVDPIANKFKAVFDAHASDAPGWGEHTATYDCPVSPEWATWKKHDGEKMGQETFAFFIEQNILDVHEPNGAQMLEIVTTLKSTKNVQFDSGIRLDNGQVQLKYHEEAKNTAGATGQLQIPEEIKLGLPVYVGGTPYAVKAKFRYRIDGTKLFMWYDLIRPHKIEEDAIKALITEVAEGTKITPYKATV